MKNLIQERNKNLQTLVEKLKDNLKVTGFDRGENKHSKDMLYTICKQIVEHLDCENCIELNEQIIN